MVFSDMLLLLCHIRFYAFQFIDGVFYYFIVFFSHAQHFHSSDELQIAKYFDCFFICFALLLFWSGNSIKITHTHTFQMGWTDHVLMLMLSMKVNYLFHFTALNAFRWNVWWNWIDFKREKNQSVLCKIKVNCQQFAIVAESTSTLTAKISLGTVS